MLSVTPATLARTALASLLAMICLCLVWELWLAPLRPGGSWLVLKVLPLLAPLFGVLHARRYTMQWCSLLALAYLAEGVVRATTESGISRWLALFELIFALGLFFASALYARVTRQS